MSYRTYSCAVTLTGGAGASAGSSRKGIPGGLLRGIQVKYLGQPGTVDVLVKAVLDGVTKTVLTLTSVNTDLPMTAISELAKDNVWVNTTTPVPPPVAGELVVEVAQGDDADPGVKVSFLVEA